jgi:hypothetical protein
MPSHSRTGFSDALPDTVMYDVGMQQPWSYQNYFDDFNIFTAAQWTVTETQAGATQLGASGDGGWYQTVNSAASGDYSTIQHGVAGVSPVQFFIDANSDWGFVTRFKVDNVATGPICVLGLQAAVATPDTPVNGVYIITGALGAISFSMTKASATTTLATGALMAADTFAEVGFFYDASKSIVKVYKDGAQIGEQSTLTNIPLISTGLGTTISLKNATAAARTLTVDYVMAFKRRMAVWS